MLTPARIQAIASTTQAQLSLRHLSGKTPQIDVNSGVRTCEQLKLVAADDRSCSGVRSCGHVSAWPRRVRHVLISSLAWRQAIRTWMCTHGLRKHATWKDLCHVESGSTQIICGCTGPVIALTMGTNAAKGQPCPRVSITAAASPLIA